MRVRKRTRTRTSSEGGEQQRSRTRVEEAGSTTAESRDRSPRRERTDGGGEKGGDGGDRSDKGQGKGGQGKGGQGKSGQGRSGNKRRRSRSSQRRGQGNRPRQPKDGRQFWGDPERLPSARTDVRLTSDPDAVPRSLGPPPLPGHEQIAAHYFGVVYDRAVTTASALAAAGGLIDPDALADEDDD